MTNAITRLSLKDLESDRDGFCQELYLGLREYGFVILRDHGIDKARLDKAYMLAKALFDLPVESKLKYDSGSGGQRGYTAFGRENAKGNPHADLKEFWHIGQHVTEDSPYYNSYPANVWPEEMPEFQPFFTDLYRELETLGKNMLELLGEAMGLEKEFFRNLVTDGNSICRLLHYPKLEEVEAGDSMRAAPHADINLLTLLVGATDSGLELLDKDGNWMPVISDENEIVLDTGDMMSRLTNDVLPSTIHRVVNPNSTNKSRYSMPFFLHPHSNASLNCLAQCAGPGGSKYPPITAGEFLQQRLHEIGLIKDQKPS